MILKVNNQISNKKPIFFNINIDHQLSKLKSILKFNFLKNPKFFVILFSLGDHSPAHIFQLRKFRKNFFLENCCSQKLEKFRNRKFSQQS